jgi:hypothetical protein
MDLSVDYKAKYLKYKAKYLDLKAQMDGGKVIGTGNSAKVDLENKSLLGPTQKFINLVIKYTSFGPESYLQVSSDKKIFKNISPIIINITDDKFIVNVKDNKNKIYNGMYTFSKNGITKNLDKSYGTKATETTYNIISHTPYTNNI